MKNKIETTGGDGISFFLLVCLFAGAATSDSFKSLSLSLSLRRRWACPVIAPPLLPTDRLLELVFNTHTHFFLLIPASLLNKRKVISLCRAPDTFKSAQ